MQFGNENPNLARNLQTNLFLFFFDSGDHRRAAMLQQGTSYPDEKKPPMPRREDVQLDEVREEAEGEEEEEEDDDQAKESKKCPPMEFSHHYAYRNYLAHPSLKQTNEVSLLEMSEAVLGEKSAALHEVHAEYERTKEVTEDVKTSLADSLVCFFLSYTCRVLEFFIPSFLLTRFFMHDVGFVRGCS